MMINIKKRMAYWATAHYDIAHPTRPWTPITTQYIALSNVDIEHKTILSTDSTAPQDSPALSRPRERVLKRGSGAPVDFLQKTISFGRVWGPKPAGGGPEPQSTPRGGPKTRFWKPARFH